MGENLDYIKMFARLPAALRRFARHRMTRDEAERIVRARLEHRAENFLSTIDTSIYQNPSSPYRWLLKGVGCEFGDLRALVAQKGLEPALRALRQEGVYVTYEEFKGRKPMVRSGKTLQVKPRDFDNPHMQRVFEMATGGSTGAAVSVGVDLDQIVASAPHELLTQAAHGLLELREVRWNGILPALSLQGFLRAIYIGHPPERWFSHIGWHDSKHWVKYGLATYYVIFWARLYGLPLPLPEYVDSEHALVIAKYLADILHADGRCYFQAGVSHAARVSRAAQEAGIDLTGTVIRGGGEPVTPAKFNQITSSGARFLPSYGTVETSRIAAACGCPIAVDEVHLMSDAYVLFTQPYFVPAAEIEVPAFNLTTLLPTAPKVLLNYQMDDYGIVEERHCGCGMEQYGLTTHLRGIRSYSKLTGEGVTLIGNDIARLIEELLPARFGGTSLDYQLLEEEDEQGVTRLYLVISPRVEIQDEQAVVAVLLRALGEASPMADAARSVWQQNRTIQVKRMEPIMTARGKMLPLHIQHRVG